MIVPVFDTLFYYIIALIMTFNSEMICKSVCWHTLCSTFVGLHELDNYGQYLQAFNFKH